MALGNLLVGHQGYIFRLSDIVELVDTLVGGKRTGKRGRGAEGKVSVRVACENRDGRPGFLAMKVVASDNKSTVAGSSRGHIKASQTVCTDGPGANNGVQLHPTHLSKVKPPRMASDWLSRVHVAIASLERFLLGTFHGTSKRYLQGYLNEFCYRFSRRFWAAEISNRLMRLCVEQSLVSIYQCNTVPRMRCCYVQEIFPVKY